MVNDPLVHRRVLRVGEVVGVPALRLSICDGCRPHLVLPTVVDDDFRAALISDGFELTWPEIKGY
jgi:hypothetical protein